MSRLAVTLAALFAIACGSASVSPPAQQPVIPPVVPPPPPGGFDLAVESIQVTQAVQTAAGTVPLVRNRAGLARVFLRASAANSMAPTVRVTLVETATGSALRSWDVPAPAAGVPTAPAPSPLGASWNVSLAAADLQPGRHLVAEIDPAGTLSQDRTNDVVRYPASGSLDVRTVPGLALTLVPVLHAGSSPANAMPNVTSATRTAQSWAGTTLRLHPLPSVDVQVAASPYTTSLSVTNDSAVWSSLLSELRTKRSVDGSSRSYVGVVSTTYSSGIAGIGYIGLPVAISWDKSSYQTTTAHELGHNFGRLHAPCGGVSGADPSWPTAAAYAGALIGSWGWDPAANTLVDPAVAHDLMSYCNNPWTSDYTYAGVLSSLATGALVASGLTAEPPAREQCLVVSGRIAGGQVEVDPAFVVQASPSLPPPGPYALELVDASGSVLGTVPFAGDLVESEVPGEADQHHFALALPVSSGWARDLAHLRVVDRATRRPLPAGAAPAPRRVGAQRQPALAAWPGRSYVTWDSAAHPRALVLDPRTGELLGTLRGGEAFVSTDARDLELLLSDGIRTERRLLRAGP
jgi:hypothetical protein